jgi:hypothetical protein
MGEDARAGGTDFGWVSCAWPIECDQVIEPRTDMKCHNIDEWGRGGIVRFALQIVVG